MKTRYEQMTKGGIDGYANYVGDDEAFKDWFCVYGHNRDSDCLIESNFETILKHLGGEGDNVMVVREGHWAVGWIEQIYVKPDTKECKLAEEVEEQLEGYPVFDEDDFCQRESDEANEVWKNCYSDKDRIKYMRDHASQFEFHNFSDMLGCARGKYFAGYASELLE